MSRLTQRMEDLIETLLQYSRLGREALTLEKTDLNMIMRDIIESLQIRLDEESVEVLVLRPLPSVDCDRIRIAQVFRNLISNAMKYNDKSDKWIEIGYSESGGGNNSYLFYVRDNGIGIKEKHYGSIFRIFKRLHGRDKFGGGTGAGLTIVKKILERHGGQICVDSEPGVGTTFHFILTGDMEYAGSNREAIAGNPVG